MHGSGAGEGHLAANPPRPLEKDHVVPGRRCLRGRGEARGPGADDDDPPRIRGELGRRQRPFSPGAGILRAGDRRAGVVVRDAGVAADAAHHCVELPLPRLARHVRVGDERPGHADGVATALADQTVRLDGIDDPRGGEDRQADLEGCSQRGDGILRDGRRRHDPGRANVGGRVSKGETDVVDVACDFTGHRSRRLRVRAQPHAQG